MSRELDVEVAEKVMGEPQPKIVECDSIKGRCLSPSWFHVHVCELEPVAFSSNISAAMEVEDRIAELGLQDRYTSRLGEICEDKTRDSRSH